MASIALVVLLIYVCGNLNGWLNADSYNKKPFSYFDGRDIYDKIPLLFPFLSIVLYLTPAVVAFVTNGLILGAITLLLTFAITRISGKYFLKKKLLRHEHRIHHAVSERRTRQAINDVNEKLEEARQKQNN